MDFTEEEIKATAKLKNLEERKEKIAQKKKELERKEALLNRALSEKNRAKDTNRKILLGAFLLNQMNGNPETRLNVLNGLNTYLTKDRDRDLFPELAELSPQLEEA